MKIIRTIVGVVLLLVFVFNANESAAQRFTKKKRYFAIGTEFNQNLYFGDVYSNVEHVRSGMGIHAQYKFRPKTSLHLSWNYAMIVGNNMDAPGTNPNTNTGSLNPSFGFLSRSNKVSMLLRWDLLENRKYFHDRSRHNLYGLFGPGINFSNVKYYQFNNSNQIPENEAFGILTAGIGYSIKLMESFDGFIEFRDQIFFQDLIDNVSLRGPDHLRTVAIGLRGMIRSGRGSFRRRF